MTDVEVTPLHDRLYYSTLMREIGNARSRIWAMLFITDVRIALDEDYLVRTIVAGLQRAQERNVDVRVLLGRSTNLLIELANRASYQFLVGSGIQARLYRHRRPLHAKYVLIDDRIALTGSHNWSHDGLAIAREDSLLLSSEEFVRRLSLRFSQVWRRSPTPSSSASDGPWLLGKRPPVEGFVLTQESSPLFASGTMLVDAAYRNATLRALNSAKSTIDIAMFLMTGSGDQGAGPLTYALAQAQRRGVAVRVLLDKDAETDPYKSAAINSRAAKQLRQAGVEVQFDSPKRLLHSKLVVVDGRVAIVGSHNWTGASIDRYHDVSVLLRSPELASLYRRRFDTLWPDEAGTN